MTGGTIVLNCRGELGPRLVVAPARGEERPVQALFARAPHEVPERTLLRREIRVERIAEFRFEVHDDETRITDDRTVVRDERNLLRRRLARIAQNRNVGRWVIRR